MWLETVIVALPFLVMLVVLGLGHDITDQELIEEWRALQGKSERSVID